MRPSVGAARLAPQDEARQVPEVPQPLLGPATPQPETSPGAQGMTKHQQEWFKAEILRQAAERIAFPGRQYAAGICSGDSCMPKCHSRDVKMLLDWANEIESHLVPRS